jgi:hypothetical protein
VPLILSASERRFVAASVRRERFFLGLSVAGVAIAIGLVVYYGLRRAADPALPLALRGVLVVLILLNARQNLRQFRYARILRKLAPGDST